MTQTVANKIVTRIYGWGRGAVFSGADFADIAGTTTVNSALRRLVSDGTIGRVFAGIYDYPRYSELLEQTLGPDPYKVAQALARKFGWEIRPNRASALNLMGVSTQVPAQIFLVSDGPSRRYEYGNMQLTFQHVATKEMKFKYDESAIIVHGLKSLRPDQVDEKVIHKIRDWLPPSKRSKVLRDTKTVTAWVHDAIRKICAEDTE